MKFLTLLKRRIVWGPLLLVALYVAAERLDFTGTNSLAAAACTRELLLAKPDPLGLITQYKTIITAQARQNDLPPELMATIIYSHQNSLTSFRRYTDCAGSAFGRNLSLGLGQLRISTAAASDGVEFESITAESFKRYRALLLQPEQNIAYQARELRLMLERSNRFPGITATEIINDPVVMTLLMSEYRAGRQEADSKTARLSANAFWDLRFMLGNDVHIFGRNPTDIASIKAGVRDYLDEIYCERGMFNAATCEKWRASPERKRVK